MERRRALVGAAVAVLAVGVTAVAVTDDDAARFGRGAMMSPGSFDDPDRSRGRQHGWTMPSPRHMTEVTSEYAYLTEMVAHHEEAVTAAQQLERSPRAEMRAFGEAVVATQSAQIEVMEQWLTDWYPDRTGQADHQPMMRDLTGLSGDRLDRVFLQDMVGHHMGAVMRSQRLLMGGVADHDQVEALARTIRDEQHAEILRMQQWLREWFDQGWHQGGYGAVRPGLQGGGMRSWTMH